MVEVAGLDLRFVDQHEDRRAREELFHLVVSSAVDALPLDQAVLDLDDQLLLDNVFLPKSGLLVQAFGLVRVARKHCP